MADCEVGGIRLEKGTAIMVDVWSVHRDKEVWGSDAEAFRPERFEAEEDSGRPPLAYARAIDTIEIAKSKIPGARYSLDELCKRFGIDLSARSKHGALLDAELTARVYLELVGGRQTHLKLAPLDGGEAVVEIAVTARMRPRPLTVVVTDAEREAHALFVDKELGDNPLWRRA